MGRDRGKTIPSKLYDPLSSDSDVDLSGFPQIKGTITGWIDPPMLLEVIATMVCEECGAPPNGMHHPTCQPPWRWVNVGTRYLINSQEVSEEEFKSAVQAAQGL